MRAIPRPKHYLAVIILAAVAAAYGYQAIVDESLSDTQITIATATLKKAQPALYPHDPAMGPGGLWKFQTPLFQAVLETALIPTEYKDPSLPFRVLAPVAAAIFLVGMYGVLFQQCRSWSISVFVAILSSAVLYTLGRAYWGIGSLKSITPEALCLSLLPLVVMSFLRYEKRPQILLVFAGIGLMGNLHLVTAMNLTIVLLFVWIIRQHPSRKNALRALGCAAAAMLCALPYAAYYYQLRYALTPGRSQLDFGTLRQAFRFEHNLAGIFYPQILESLLSWLLVTTLLVLLALAVLIKVERFRTRHLGFWSWMMMTSLLVSLGLHGLSQLYGSATGQAPPVVDFYRAASFVMLPVFVLVAQAITNLFRLVREHRLWLRAALALLMAGWMLPSDNLAVVRRGVVELATARISEVEKPASVQRHHDRRNQIEELTRLADWARRNTPNDAVFFCDDPRFRLLARRSIAASGEDIGAVYYVLPRELSAWTNVLTRQEALLRPSGPDKETLAGLRSLAADLSSQKGALGGATHWYAIVSEQVGGEGMVLPPDEAWGRFYHLYRVQ